MVFRLLRLDGIPWIISELGKQVLILEPKVKEGHLEKIHRIYQIIDKENDPIISDIVPAYTSIAIYFSASKEKTLSYLKLLDFSKLKSNTSITKVVDVHYNNGLDWENVLAKTGLSKSEIIEKHSSPVYTVAMIGFIPGFIFLDGLMPELAISRLNTPRTKIPAGSIGIGGNQTGIYSLESPGGWNIIGSTNQQFFDIKNQPPISVSPGDKMKFNPILD